MNTMTRTRALTLIFSLITVLVATSGCGLFGSEPTASLILPAKVAAGEKVTAEGVYSRDTPGLEVILRERSDAEPLATTTTSKTGQYSLEFTTKEPGPREYTVVVIDGDDEVTSTARKLNVLGKTAIVATLSGPPEADLKSKRSLKGKVDPAGVRDIVLEESADGKVWKPSSVTAETDSKGTFALPVSTSTVGERYYRATVLESDNQAEASTTEQWLTVYNYRAHGKKYEACVEELNRKIGEFSELEGLETIKASAVRMSRRSTTQAKCFRGHNWPPSVAADIEAIAANSDLDADVYSQMANADSLEEIEDLSYTFTDDPGAPTRVRAALGLRKRPAP